MQVERRIVCILLFCSMVFWGRSVLVTTCSESYVSARHLGSAVAREVPGVSLHNLSAGLSLFMSPSEVQPICSYGFEGLVSMGMFWRDLSSRIVNSDVQTRAVHCAPPAQVRRRDESVV